MNESLEHQDIEEPKVSYAQDSGCMLLYIELEGKLKLEGSVSYPYLPRSKRRDYENGMAEIQGFSIGHSLSPTVGEIGLRKVFLTFLQNIANLSANKLTFRLHPNHPEWLIEGLIAFPDSYGLELDSIQSVRSSSTIERDKFMKNARNYLPAVLVANLSKNARFRLQQVLGTSEQS
ncbi:MAG: hypothetical protein A2V81_02870 [Candidatus Abawacabacteria bacterium RBG_16_42_10]|uniref:Uncharacterized protein n=1 Tax=Candidatus Abawacabacteria bacterium RBG_16_42_10 TaxID=1817814 RepID=A0A1F4XKA1_9BACT|nr:MAG: hypothetical protein A2V81_02870 [Candidatus Abawacabacteria bacterium RBG_16_42_10]